MHLYSLNLFINNTHFADKGAVSLSAGLSKLKKLHILKINLQDIPYKQYSSLTAKGASAIMKAISGMAELQILE